MKSKIQFFDRVANSRDPLLFTAKDLPKIARLRKRLGDLVGRRILEPGCGAGPLTEHLAKWVGPDGEVVAFDYSTKMVAACRRRAGHLPQVTVKRGPAEKLVFPRNRFDLILCFRVLPHFDDRKLVFKRFYRWLKPDGRLVIAHLEGSRSLNRMHRSVGGPIRCDRFPARPVLEAEVTEASFKTVRWIDNPKEIFIELRPCDTGEE